MKKTISAATAALLAALSALPLAAKAENYDTYSPTFYFRANSAVLDEKTGDTVILASDIPEEGLDLRVDVYSLDLSKRAFWISPKWKCSDPLIKLKDLYDPSTGDEIYAYSTLKEDGTITNNTYSVSIRTDDNYNTMACSVIYQYYEPQTKTMLPMIPYCDPTDQYPLTHFTASISSELTYGYHTIHFLTEAEDYADQRVSEANLYREDGTSLKRDPIVEDMTIRISGIEGDVNGDGFVDSSDASDVLVEYAALQTGQESTLDDRGRFAADTDHDRIIDSTDASNILVYYAYVMSTEDPVSFLEYNN